MSAKRVLHLIWSFQIGGAEKFVLNMARRTDRSRYTPAICALGEGPLREEADSLGIPVFQVERGRTPVTLARLCRVIRKHKPDLIHAHSLAPGFYGALAGALCRVPVLTTRHGRPEESTERSLFRLISNRLTSRFIAVSEEVRQLLVAHSGIPERNIAAIVNGIDTERYVVPVQTELRAQLGIPPSAFLFGTVGRLSPSKAQQLMLSALRRVLDAGRDAALVIAGEGSERTKLEQVLAEQELEGHARLLGAWTDVPGLLSILDAFVLSSVDEGVPLSLLEAMSAERPCVTTKVGGLVEVLEDGKTGLLVETGDVDALAAAMQRLMDDATLRANLAREGAQSVRARFSIEAMIEAYLEHYDDLVYRRNRARPITLNAPGPVSRKACAMMSLASDKGVRPPMLALESDDWGQTATPSREVYDALCARGLIVPANRWAADALETPEDIGRLCETLSCFPDSRGRSLPVTANFIVANPDFAQITADDLPFIPITSEDAGNPVAPALRAAWLDAAQKGFLCPEYHGLWHFAPEALRKFWVEESPEVKPFLDAGMRPAGLTSGNGRRLLSEYVLATPDGGALKARPPLQQRRTVREGVSIFESAFGRSPASTVAPHYLWTDDTERIWAEAGIRSIQAVNRFHGIRNRFGFLKVRRMAMGVRAKSGLTYLARNVRFEPAIYDDTADQAFAQVRKAFMTGRPAVISCHRINFSGAIFPEQRDKALAELGHLLARVREHTPDVVFATSAELASRLDETSAPGLATAVKRLCIH